MNRLLRRAARYWGLQIDYTNAAGKTVKVKETVLRSLLAELGDLPAESDADLGRLCQGARRNRIERRLEPVYVLNAQSPVLCGHLQVEEIKHAVLRIETEDGRDLRLVPHPQGQARRHVGDQEYLRVSFESPESLPVGYHRASLELGQRRLARALLIHPPPPPAAAPQKKWGLFAPLYAVRDERNWGCGDVHDLSKLQDITHERGGSFVGTLPLLASQVEGENADPSPYSPVSRLFWNELFLDVEALAAESPRVRKKIQAPSIQKQISSLREAEAVDYPALASLKKPLLMDLAEEFFAKPLPATYGEFIHRVPWAEEYARFRAGEDEKLRRYHLYVQFQMHRALEAQKEKARENQTAGLYLDFPVGASRHGFDAQFFKDSFLSRLDVGAPPDMFFSSGQNWGFSPLHPQKQREQGYEYLIHCLRHHLQYCQYLRFDHVMSLQRLYVMPAGHAATEGSYIRYPSREIFAILAVESSRAGARIIGEDLGTVSASLREELTRNGGLGMWVLPFEAGSHPAFAIHQAPRASLCCLNTHDMVPFEGYCRGRDIEFSQRLGLIDSSTEIEEKRERQHSLALWSQELHLRDRQDLFPRLLEDMARGPSEMLLINIEDLWHESEPQNLPGIRTEPVPWTRKFRQRTSQWAKDPVINALLQRVNSLRGENAYHWNENDLYLFNEGRLHRAYLKMGAHPGRHQGKDGTWFSVWAPGAARVDVIGEFNDWRSDGSPLKPQASSGVWSGFVPGARENQTYKYRIHAADGEIFDKADPYAFAGEEPPRTASRISSLEYRWGDQNWMASRQKKQAANQAMSIYEVHAGSWRRREDGRPLTYRELAEELPAYVRHMGFTHVEFLPLAEHPFYGSWGYQVTGYFAPTARYGRPQDFMYLVDRLHQEDIGVIMDWVPSHFPADAFALARFDGTHLYEHADPRLGYHPDWKSLIFNYGRHEVRSFLISSALFWLDLYHIDGLRVDAVASMLYLDYSRKAGEWLPNVHGGRENLEALRFIREFNEAVYGFFSEVHTIAEESTAWPKVSAPTYAGGLGFGMKWDMGWMHDSLRYFQKDPIHRRFHQDQLSFRMLYAFNENFVLSLSHDEVVYGKGSLINKMSGDEWQKFANLRALYAYMFAMPGKKLLFMGGEFAQGAEWNHDRALDWGLTRQAGPQVGVQNLVRDLNGLYQREEALHALDFSPAGFEWLDADDRENSVLSFFRYGRAGEKILCAFNLTPVPRETYRLGVNEPGLWQEILNTDSPYYGGGGIGNLGQARTEEIASHGRPHSLRLRLPPLGAVYFKYEGKDQ